MRVTLDTNVLISAFITTEGIASRVLLRSLEQHQTCFSDYILREFREKLIRKLQYPSGLVDIFLKFLASRAQLFSVRSTTAAPDFSDSKDIPILQLLEVAEVHYFVTGDKKLLGLKKHKQTLILSLREALELL
jgi:putative PIN family toxin of toxin-antitoxin system